MSLLRTSLATGLLTMAVTLWAQPACDFSLGPDVDLCAGQTAILSGPAGYSDYLWSTGATTQDLPVTTAGNYTLQVTYTTANLAVNGDFSAGNAGFTTQYNYNSNLQTEGNYYIGTNASTYHPFWQGSWNGNFLMVNAGLFQFQWTFWCQTITVCPNTTYTLSYTAANLSDVGPAQVQWLVDGASQGTTNITGFLGAFNTYTTTWTSGPAQTSADFCLRMVNTTGTGHDLGIDEISITGEVIMTDDIDVNVIPVPVVDLGPDTAGCAGTLINLNAASPTAVSYLWSTGLPTSNINVASGGIYWVDVTFPSGCVARDSITVTINPIPSVFLGPDAQVCPGDSITLDATYPNATYEWSTLETTPTITVGPGSYSVIVEANGCTSTDNINISNFAPPGTDLGNDTTLCPGESIWLDATGNGLSYEWQDGSLNPTFFVDQAGTYWVTVTDLNSCVYADTITVSYAAPLPVELGNDTTICENSGFLVDATTAGATGYLWNTGDTTPSIIVNTAGFYFVNVFQGNCTITDFIDIQTLPSPNVNLGPDFSLCPGQTAVLDATSPGVSYAWQDGSVASTFVVDQPGTYWVDVTNVFGCTGTDTVVVSFLGQVNPDLGPDTTICQGNVLTLNGTTPGATGYLWSTGAGTPTINVSNAGLYWVQANLGGGCSVRDSITVQTSPVPTVDLGNDTTLCPGTSLDLDATFAGATYLWSTSSTAPSITVNTTGNYWVEVDLNGCTASDTVQVDFLANLSLDLGNDTALCQGEVLTLNASLPGGTTTWSNGFVGPSIQVSTSDTVWATIDLSGCTVSDTIIVQVLPVPTVDLGNDTTFCLGGQLVLDATNPGAAYLWDDGSIQATRIVSQTGTYWVDVTIGGCAATDTMDVTVLPAPVIDLGNDTSLCAGDVLTLDATWPGATYLWQDGSNAATFSTDSAGTYSVEVTLAGCTTTDTLTVLGVVQPVAQLGNDTLICDGATLLLNATLPGAGYLWSDGSQGPTLLVDAAGTYWVEVSIGSCGASDTLVVDQVPGGLIDLGPDVSLCPDEVVVLDAGSPGAPVTWQDGSNDNTLVADTDGTYWASANVSGCIQSDTVVVSLVDISVPDLGGPVVICGGDSVVFSVDPQGADVLWWNGSADTIVTVFNTQLVTVAFQLDGCTTSDQAQVTVIDGVVIDLGPDDLLCPGSPRTLHPGVQDLPFLWSDGSEGDSLVVDQPGIYWVQAQAECALVGDTIILVEGNCPPEIFVPNAFTPNGDGINDLFLPVIYATLIEYELDIFDRWGERIFNSEDPFEPWDGSLNGTEVQDGVYIWQVRYKASTVDAIVGDKLIGHVTLLR